MYYVSYLQDDFAVAGENIGGQTFLNSNEVKVAYNLIEISLIGKSLPPCPKKNSPCIRQFPHQEAGKPGQLLHKQLEMHWTISSGLMRSQKKN